MYGYKNSLLRINLSSKNITKEPLNKEWTEKYFGGKGLGIKYLYEEIKAGTDPLSPENKLILMTGPLTGTTIPCSGKLAIISRSPATGTILDCSIGGHTAGEIKYAGYDGIIIEGSADKPSIIYIKDDKVELLPAEEYWGLPSHETETKLINKYGTDFKVLSIGPAGENLLPISCINSDYYRQAGRGGIGAVMGSKNIKAIVIKGTGSVHVADMDKAINEVYDIIQENTLTDDNLWAFTDGTPLLVDMSNASGILVTHNYQDGTYEQSSLFNSDSLKAVRSGKRGCFSCVLGCGNFSKMNDAIVEGPEYETLVMGGSNCGISDLESIIKFNELCDDMGLDTISVGNIIGFIMELTEKGIKDFGIKFGDVDAYLSIPEKIARKEGIGVELALGVKELSRRYGGSDFAMHVKGLELPGYDPRGSWGMGLSYATADRGGCHMRAWTVPDEAYSEDNSIGFTIEGKAKLVSKYQDYNGVKFSIDICDFWAVDIETLARVLNIITGKEYTVENLEKGGERITNLARLFNIREGFSKKDDTLPNRIFKDALKSGATKDKLLPRKEFDKMLAEYYELRNWTEDGTIPESKIKELGI